MTVRAKERAQRILLVLAHVLDRQDQGFDVTVDELVERFDLTEAELTEDMSLVFYDVGVSPFTPDSRVEVWIDDGLISVRLGDYFRRPLRLTSEEALYLLTAGEAMLAAGTVPAAALSSAVAKLEQALGATGDVLDVDLTRVDPVLLAEIGSAVEAHRVLELDYHSFGRGATGTRTVEPYALHARDGHWYLAAWCRQADDVRQFRLDRVLTARPTGEQFTPRDDVDLTDDFRAPDGRTVALDVPPSARWVAETFPVESVESGADGRLRIVLVAGTDAFLERLLLRLGTDVTATDVATGESVLDLRRAAARRLLTAYGD